MTPPEVIEREIPDDRVLNLRELLCDGTESEHDFGIIEDLTTSALFSRFESRRIFATVALSRFLQSTVQICTMTTDSEVYAYLTLADDDSQFLFVGAYPNQQTMLEAVPTEREVRILGNFGR